MNLLKIIEGNRLERYRNAVEVLDLKKEVRERLMGIEDIDMHKKEIAKVLDGVKLWNYPPEAREDVKAARELLRQLIEDEEVQDNRLIDIPMPEAMSIWKVVQNFEHLFGFGKIAI